MQLTINTWDGPILHSDEIDDPTAGDVATALDRLDGAATSEISLTQDEPFAQFTVGGGPDLFLVTGETPEEEILQLTTPDAPDEAVSLVTGGQVAEFKRHDLVTRERALAALQRFLAGEPHDPTLPWDVQ